MQGQNCTKIECPYYHNNSDRRKKPLQVAKKYEVQPIKAQGDVYDKSPQSQVSQKNLELQDQKEEHNEEKRKVNTG